MHERQVSMFLNMPTPAAPVKACHSRGGCQENLPHTFKTLVSDARAQGVTDGLREGNNRVQHEQRGVSAKQVQRRSGRLGKSCEGVPSTEDSVRRWVSGPNSLLKIDP